MKTKEPLFSFRNLYKRWKSAMPLFWKKVLYLMAFISFTATTIELYISTNDIQLLPIYDKILSHCIGIGIVGMILAKLTKEDYPNIKQ